ncbi:MFS transporter [Alphaproteobacteria bacterium LMG 31809]|uniref:MFS transporter n=2 Tax=Govanella unica TaxID=2975056 RepID=A0A9X3Z722_9PROT|nr:MFS transporter [Govania unica]MDA5193519.1 MFS transporter [Govania unica]
MLVAYTSSFIDRQIMTLLVGPIRADLKISVTEFSLLVGLAFSLFYSMSGVPLAYLSDRYSRIRIIMIGIFTWSIMTMLCGFAGSFGPLFLARMGVGIGEAALAPAAYSLISDSFPPERRGRAMGVYSMGAYVGGGLALVIGGAVISMIEHAKPITLPLVGTLQAWQTTFFYVGLPGFLIVLALMFCREPARQGITNKPSLSVLFAFMRQQSAVFWTISIGSSLFGIAAIGYLVWMPSILIHQYGWSASKTGYIYGSILLIFSTSGSFCGGWIADILTQRGIKDGALRTLIGAILLAIPFAVSTPFMTSDIGVTVMLAALSFCFGLVQALPTTALHAVTPNECRSQITACYFVFGSIISQGIGPTLIASLTQYGFKDEMKLGLAVVVINAIMLPLAALILLSGRKAFCRSLDAIRH